MKWAKTKKFINLAVQNDTYGKILEITKKRNMRVDEWVRQLIYNELNGIKKFD